MTSKDRSDGVAPLAEIGQLGLETASAVVERMLDLTRRVGDLRRGDFDGGPKAIRAE